MTTLAQRIEQTLRDHGAFAYPKATILVDAFEKHERELSLLRLRDALLALVPQRSRESLISLMAQHPYFARVDSDHINEIMFWATGEPTDPMGAPPSTAADIADAAIHSTDRMVRHQVCLVCRHCIGCPVCAAPRLSAG